MRKVITVGVAALILSGSAFAGSAGKKLVYQGIWCETSKMGGVICMRSDTTGYAVLISQDDIMVTAGKSNKVILYKRQP